MLKIADVIPDDKNESAAAKNKLVRKAFAMLRAFHGPEEWLTSLELSQRAHLPKASGHRLIQTLEEIGAVVRGPNGRYRLGMMLVTLSHNVAIGELLRDAAQPILAQIAGQLGLTMHMGVLEDSMVTYVCKIDGSADFLVHTRVDAQHEAYCSGLGKVLLGALSPAALESFLLDGKFVALTPRTITDRAVLRSEVEKARINGYAVDNEESALGMRCIAVPIRDADGYAVAAISATGQAARLVECHEMVRDTLLAAAAEIGRKFNPDR